jgi:NodT family efflux transporter outer membrane factor (OMF) lipoprotein
MPATYKEASGWKTAQPGGTAITGEWWLVFNDPTLNDLEQQVNVSNQNLLAAEAAFRQASAAIQAARAAAYPTVSAGASATRARSSATDNTLSQTYTTYTLPVDFSWEIDLWGRVRRNVEASTATAQASAADLALLRLSTQAQLAQTYFQLRMQDAQQVLLDATVSNYKKTLELTRNLYAAGVDASSDVLLAETQLETTQAQAIDLGVLRAQLEHAIATLIGKPASSFRLPVAPLVEMLPSIPTGVPSDLLERRPDIAMAERQMAAENAQIGVAEAAWYPSITLSASGGLESSSLSHWFSWPSRFWSVGPSVSETLYDGGLRASQSSQARAAYDAGVANYRQTVLAAFQDVEDNLAALRILESEARVQDEAVRTSRKSVVVAENQYRSGTVSYLNVLTAQTAELGNERTAITLRGNRMMDSVLLIKALGGGWDASVLKDVENGHK